MRGLYRFVVRLHPSEFRDRFGDEMLCIFDEAAIASGSATFILDGCCSLVRQWLRRAQVWKWAAAALGGVITLVAGFGSFLPWQKMWAALRTAL
jgi:hypothetical protein